MERIAERIITKLIKYRIIEEDEEEMGVYVVVTRMEQILSFLIIGILAILHDVLGPTLLLLLFFFPIRRRAGGYHAETFCRCIVTSVGIYLVFVRIVFPLLNRYMLFDYILLVSSALIIIYIGAINHPNINWSKGEHSASKKIVRKRIVIELIIIFIFEYLDIESKYIVFMSFGVMLSALLLVLARIMKMEVL